MFQRFKLTIEYDGTAFAGWQRQVESPSVQESIEKALAQFVPHQNPPPNLWVAGRTDAGVHALGQVAHVDLPIMFSSQTVKRALNFYLANDRITILNAEKVSLDFHARFSATKRIYLYRIINRSEKLSLENLQAWHVPFPLDLSFLKQGAQYFVGQHDFSSFRASYCQAKSPIKTLDKFDIRISHQTIECLIEAPSFLHHQVRNMMGTLVEVGRGKMAPIAIKEILQLKDRTKAGPTAPPHGLYLKEVIYPPSVSYQITP